jgi:TonB-dependent SusC/RagA subfamily outer membrane receptor
MQKLQLAIPEPCHENWQQMTPTGQGRFCNACAKEVIDFSMMTDTEVLNYFTSRTHDKVCGRALPSQLERTISKPKDPTKRLFWYWNYIVMFFMFFGKGNSAKAQGGIKPGTEINPVKANDIRGDIVVANVGKREGNRIISGKVTDKDGNPVSFATVKIKGTNTGISADANGVYSIRVNNEDVLTISGVSFKSVEEAVGLRSVINAVLEGGLTGFVIVETDLVYSAPDKINAVAILKIKDEETGQAIPDVAIVTTVNSKADTTLTDRKGQYKIKGIKQFEHYFIKVMADGYEPNEFTINSYDFLNRKKEWNVLLRKQKSKIVRSTETAKICKETSVRIRCGNGLVGRETLYVVDGTIWPYKPEINPDDIEDYLVIQGPAAAALFGYDGANGAVLITTRKAKEIKMKELVVTSEFGIKGAMRMAGGISFTNTYENSFLGDTIATIKTLLSDSIKVYPNPVQRNTVFSVALKLKQAGNYSMQVTDASGRIQLQQKFNAGSKNHTEKIMSDSRWAGGIYYIRVFDAQNKLINKSSFIVQ